MDHVSINVLDLAEATRFFVSLGFVVKGEWEASGTQLEQFGETYRLCYVRRPEGILLELAETIPK